MNTGGRIDAWMQHPSTGFLEQPMFDSLRRWTGRSGFGAVPLASTVQAMDAAGIDIGVLCAWHGPQGALITNAEVAACIAAYPDRFIALASVDLRQPVAAVRELRRLVREEGFRGLRMIPWLWGLPPDDRRYYPLYAECVELDVPFCTQIGHTGPLLSSEPGRPIPYLEHVALEFPELRIVAGHVGAPWTAEAISLAHKFPNFYLDTSAYKISRLPPEFAAYLRTSGSSKVLFGSNYPMLAPGDCLAALPELGLDPQAEARFLHGNARAVFGLSPLTASA